MKVTFEQGMVISIAIGFFFGILCALITIPFPEPELEIVERIEQVTITNTDNISYDSSVVEIHLTESDIEGWDMSETNSHELCYVFNGCVIDDIDVSHWDIESGYSVLYVRVPILEPGETKIWICERIGD